MRCSKDFNENKKHGGAFCGRESPRKLKLGCHGFGNLADAAKSGSSFRYFPVLVNVCVGSVLIRISFGRSEVCLS